MRVEKTYPGAIVVKCGRLRGTVGQAPATIRYYSTGETPPVDTCYCTFCGKPTRPRGDQPLPPCPSCDNTEYISPDSEVSQVEPARL